MKIAPCETSAQPQTALPASPVLVVRSDLIAAVKRLTGAQVTQESLAWQVERSVTAGVSELISSVFQPPPAS